jgi:hypothetical protein
LLKCWQQGNAVATENQYAFFKSLYDEEEERAKILAEHAKNNLGLATLYSAFILFVIEKQTADIAWLGKLLFCCAILCMLSAQSWKPSDVAKKLLIEHQILQTQRNDAATIDRKVMGVPGKRRYYLIDQEKLEAAIATIADPSE